MSTTPKALDHRDFSRRAFIAAGAALALLALALLLWKAVEVVFLFFAGVLLAVLLHTLASFLHRRTRLPHTLAVVVVFLALAALLVGATASLAPAVVAQLREAADRLPEAFDAARERVAGLAFGRAVLDEVPSAREVGERAVRLLPEVGGAFTTTLGLVVDVAIVLVTALYLAIDPRTYRRGILSLFGEAPRARAAAFFDAVATTLRWWLLGRLITMGVVAAITSVGLLLLGIPAAIALGLLAGLLSFIPYIGFLLAGIPIVLFGLAQGLTDGLYALLLYLGVQAVEGYLIEPIVEKRTVKVPPVFGIFAQILLGLVGGVPAVVVAAPAAAVLLVAVRKLYIEPFVGRRARVDDEPHEHVDPRAASSGALPSPSPA